jgi:UrcA family protein
MFKLVSVIALALSAAALTPAGAQEVSQPVSYGDLDLATPGGVRALETRLDAAIRQVCGGPGAFDLGARLRRKACRRATSAKVQDQVSVAVAGYRVKLARNR